MIILRSILLVWGVFSHAVYTVEASTHELSYDAIINAERYIDNSYALKLSSNIGNEAILSWHDIRNDTLLSNTIDTQIDLDPFCRYRKNSGTDQSSISCDLEFMDEDISLEMRFKLQIPNNNLEAKNVGARLDIAVTTSLVSSQDVLIDLVANLHRVIQLDESLFKPTWNIRTRNSSLETIKFHSPNDITVLPFGHSDSTTSRDAADVSSLNSLILSNSKFVEKKLVSKHKNMEVWKTTEFDTMSSSLSLFIDSKLRYTTKFAGFAHAEAFIHPVLISHPEPTNVAVISQAPLALVHEILKHKKVDSITLFNTDADDVNFLASSFPHLNDCSSMIGRKTNCLDSVKIGPDFTRDVRDVISDDFDVIFVDVPSTPSEYAHYMSLDFMGDVLDELADDSDAALVINVGSSPSGEAISNENIEDDDFRAIFLRMVTRNYEYGGLDEDYVHVYDEEDAAPLDSTFILLTGYDSESKTNQRFFRRNPAGIDIDIAEMMFLPSPQAASYPTRTLQYDGTTHLTYTRPSRRWERWYCSKNPWKTMLACTEFITKIYDTNYHVSNDTEVRLDPVKGRSLYAAEDIPKGQFILPRDAAYTISLDETHYEYFEEFIHDVPSASMFKAMFYTIEGYGFENFGYGFSGYTVTTTPASFINHGCNEDELNAEPMVSLEIDEDGEQTPYFSPVLVRNNELYTVSTFSTREILKGEEILVDYKYMVDSNIIDSEEAKMCSGGSGLITVDNKPIIIDDQEEDDDDDDDYDDDDDDDDDDKYVAIAR